MSDVRKEERGMTRRPWKTWEVKYLMNHAACRDEDVARVLGRTVQAVRVKASFLKRPRVSAAAPERVERTCLKCRRTFWAEPKMFLCDPCKGSDVFQSGMAETYSLGVL